NAPVEQVESAAASAEIAAEETALASLPDEPKADEQVALAPTPDAVVAPDVTIPTFDILRVEPDGSTLIAGRAAPESAIEIVRGSQILAQTLANAAGEFVATLEEELPQGDHALVIRGTQTDGLASTSLQTAIVAIPEDPAQGVLALVETPGEPSRLISTPQPGAPQLVPVEDDDDTPQVAAVEDQPTLSQAAPQAAPPMAPGLLTLEGSGPLLPPVATEPQPPQEQATEAQQIAEDGETGAQGEPEPEPEPEPQTEIAAARTEQAKEPTVEQASSPLRVAIEAVEVDGEDVFVAGAATPGVRLRVYANDILLGDTTADEGGRFLVQVSRDLPAGDYIIRADVLDARTAEVLRRAAVPFTRSEDIRQAAVAVAPAVTLPDDAPEIEVAAIPEVPADDPVAAEIPETAPQSAVDITPEIIAPLTDETVIPTNVGALAPTDQSVIIRKGDTLWQISRRVYGKGVKYSTIYLANQDQIKDPGRIWPGQVFSVPSDAPDDESALQKHQELRSQR
ncbi:MAG: LysM peptidoglycan-binding domain-containing protein, partial [Pseudomonadota bacterium]